MINHEFPYANLHDVNVDWILQQIKDVQNKYQDLDSTIEAGIEAVQHQEEISLQDLDNMKMTIITAINGAKDIAIVDMDATKTSAITDIETDKTNALAEIAALGNAWDDHYESLIAEMPADLASLTQTLAILGRILAGDGEQTVTFFKGDYAGGSKTNPEPSSTSDVSTNMIIGGAGLKFVFTLANNVDANTKIYSIRWFEGKNASTGVYTGEHVVSCGDVRTYTWTVPDTCYGFSITLRNSVTLFTEAPSSNIATFNWFTAFSKIVQTAVHFEDDPNANNWFSCADVPAGVIVFVASSGGTLNISDFPFNAPGTLVCIGHPNFPIQYALSWNQAEIAVKSRSKLTGGVWSNWVDSPVPSKTEQFKGWAHSAGIESCDNIDTISWYIVASDGGVPSPSDFPFNGAGWIQTIPFNNFILQIAFSFANQMKTRTKNGSVWTSWKDIGTGGAGDGWLQAVDTNTSSETGKTDMTDAIMTMLNSTGYCHLGPGIFYVRGNIDMPADSMIEGCGKNTIIRLLQSVSSGYIVRMHTRSTLKNVCLSGGYSALDISTSDIGGRKGINYIGNRDGQSSGITPTTCTCCQIEGCWFENLDSGFYGYNAGGGLQEGVEMCNCYFTHCKAGINIDYWTEYCKFTNCITFQCYYACINNGGNNVFTACTFHGVIGFLIDNSSGTKTNSAHGTVNGCTFNHIDNMNHPETLGNGYGIKVIDTTAGFIFANCQIWYGKVYIEDSKGVQFADCEFGGYPTIETSGNDTVFFHGCIFQIAPTKNITSPVKFDNCYTYAGANVTN